MGWDEILEGGIGPESDVMSWRGSHNRGGYSALLPMHHNDGGVCCCKNRSLCNDGPTEYVYLDYAKRQNNGT